MTTRQLVTMYYDDYEARFGDGHDESDGICGMFPQLSRDSVDDVEIVVQFDLEDGYWVQNNGLRIVNLDGNCGFNLLSLLNKNSNHMGIGIMNRDFKILGFRLPN
jgi:hypothetical protein